MKVSQDEIELVQGDPVTPPGLEWIARLVGGKECRRKSAKEQTHTEIQFPVSRGVGWVIEDRSAITTLACVTGPKVTVYVTGGVKVIQELGQTLYQLLDGIPQRARAAGCQGEETVLAKEFSPTCAQGLLLLERSEEVILLATPI